MKLSSSAPTENSSDLQRLEARVQVLEQMADQNIAFGQTLINAMKQITEKMGMHSLAFDKASILENNFSTYFMAEMLAKASKIYPKTKTVVFVGRNYFGDNIKYAFLAFQKEAKTQNAECYFLASNAREYEQLKSVGLPCLAPAMQDWTSDDAKILLSASVVVVCDNFHPFAGNGMAWGMLQGAKCIQLWHGIPLKEVGFQHIFSASGEKIPLALLLASAGQFEALVATSAASEIDWKRWFSFKNFSPIGYPRNDVLFREVSETDAVNVDVKTLALVKDAKQKNKPVILYAPTFRDHVNYHWFEKAKINELVRHCRTQGYFLCVNMHPFEQDHIPELRRLHPDLHFVEPGTDIYPVVKYADVMITDYSSLAFDFLLLDRPLIFYRPDHEEYITRARGLIEGRENYAPGEVVSTAAGLAKATDNAVAAVRKPEVDTFRGARETLRKKLFDYCDGKASERLVKLIMEKLA